MVLGNLLLVFLRKGLDPMTAEVPANLKHYVKLFSNKRKQVFKDDTSLNELKTKQKKPHTVWKKA